MRTIAIPLMSALLFSALPRAAAAHCDSMDGPVVKAAQTALATGNVNPVLVWVKADNEQAIRDAFNRTLQVRKLGPQARDMADMYFFETLVRLHRAGEGEPYTGLKPAGYYKGIYETADRALRSAAPTELNVLTTHISTKLAELHRAAHAALQFGPDDVAAGREFVEKYTAYMHYVETLDHLVHESPEVHAQR